jgi:hypothetical protein
VTSSFDDAAFDVHVGPGVVGEDDARHAWDGTARPPAVGAVPRCYPAQVVGEGVSA